MTVEEDEAQSRLQAEQITMAWKPSSFRDGTWRCRMMRPETHGIAIDRIQAKSAKALLELISTEAWERFPTKRDGILAGKLWSFFTSDELRQIYSMTLDSIEQK